MLVTIDDGRHNRWSGGAVPWGAWSNLLDTILRDWLTTQQTILRNRQAAKEFANG